MRLLLTGRNSLVLRDAVTKDAVPDGESLLRVLYCGVCRTDAKMWAQGHRDLILPRVPGHEIVGADDRGRRYAVWPGDSCGDCVYCRSGRENLCRRIRIVGFHRDGGFADQVLVPQASLIPIPETMDALTACLAEPVGCILHALAKCCLSYHAKVLIIGGGTMGLLAALVARESGAEPLVIEKNPVKMAAAGAFLDQAEIRCVAETHETDFDVVLNACGDGAAFCRGLEMVARGGFYSFFSGLVKDMTLSAEVINLIHYQEITMAGAYGLCREDMRCALNFIGNHQSVLSTLVADVVEPEDAPALMSCVLSGSGLKYVLNFNGNEKNA